MGKKPKQPPEVLRYRHLMRLFKSVKDKQEFERKVDTILKVLQDGEISSGEDGKSPLFYLMEKTHLTIDSEQYMPVFWKLLPNCKNLRTSLIQDSICILVFRLGELTHCPREVLAIVKALVALCDFIPSNILSQLYLMTLINSNIDEGNCPITEIEKIFIAKGSRELEARTSCLRNFLMEYVRHYDFMVSDLSTSLTQEEPISFIQIDEIWEKMLEWTDEVVSKVKTLVHKGVDPCWMEKQLLFPYRKPTLRLLMTTMNRVILYVEDDGVFNGLLEILDLLMTEEACKQVDFKGQTFFHVLVGTQFTFAEILKSKFTERFKRIVSNIVGRYSFLLDIAHNDKQTPLHVFVKSVMLSENWWTSSEVFDFMEEIIFLLKSPKNIDVKDTHGLTVLHELSLNWPFDKCSPEIFFSLLKLFLSPSNVDVQDDKDRTALHIVMQRLYETPSLVFNDVFGEIIRNLTTRKNVNLTDEELMTPYSWILLARDKGEHTSESAFLIAEEIFLKNDADKSTAISGTKCKVGHEIAEVLVKSSTKTMGQKEVEIIQKLKERGYPECMTSPIINHELEIFCNGLQRKRNQDHMMFVKNAIMILACPENAQNIWNTLIPRTVDTTSTLMLTVLHELLDQCRIMGAIPDLSDVQNMADVVDQYRSSKMFLMILNLLLQSYRTSNKSDDISIRLNALVEIYTVTEDYHSLASSIVKLAYQTHEKCLESESFVNVLLFVASGDTTNREETVSCFRMMQTLFCDNWLRRSMLHLIVMYCNDKAILECIPEDILHQYMEAKDLHGCTPVHLAYMCNNGESVDFLISRYAKTDVTDHFGVTPKDLGLRAGVTECNRLLKTVASQLQGSSEPTDNEHVDVVYQKNCQKVMMADTNVFEYMKPMLILPEEDRNLQSLAVKLLFERLSQQMPDLLKGEIVVAGSSREKLKAGRLDEVDVQIRLHILSSCLTKVSTKFHTLGNEILDENVFGEWLHACLVDNLAHIKWSGIPLRLISVNHPWEFIYERPGTTQYVQMSVDVVPIIRVEDDVTVTFPLFTKPEKIQQRQRLLLRNVESHQPMWFLRWGNQTRWHELFPTYCEFEWDILDSLSMDIRLGVLLVKALLEISYWSKGGSVTKAAKPISSYMLKTVLFWLLCDEEALRNSLSLSRGSYEPGKSNDEYEDSLAATSVQRSTNTLFSCENSPRWMDAEDLQQHAEDGRKVADLIVSTIHELANKNVGVKSYEGQILPFFEEKYSTFLLTHSNKEAVSELCEELKGRLDLNVFYKNAPLTSKGSEVIPKCD